MDPTFGTNKTPLDEDCLNKVSYDQRSIQDLQTNDNQDSLIKLVDILDTTLKLSYNSAWHPGSKTMLEIKLTGKSVPNNLWRIHARLEVEGIVTEKLFESEPQLVWQVGWTGLDTYGQKVFGRALATAIVGYEFSDCQVIL